MNFQTIQAQPNHASALVVARARAWVKPVAVVSKVRNPVRVWLSKGTKAARCPSTNVCQSVITEDALVAAGVVRRKRDGIRILAKGDVSAKMQLDVTGASKSAVEAVEKAGGSLTVKAAAAAAE